MSFRRGCATNHQWQVEIEPLHFTRNVHHFIKRWCDQTRKTDDVDVLFFGDFQNFLGRHHNPKIDDFKVITLKHHTNDVLTNIVYIAFHSGHQNLALSF